MRPFLRRYLITLGVVASLSVIGLTWFASIADPCDFEPMYEWPSPTDRYVAELYAADCGMGSHSVMLFLRDRSAVSFSFSRRPAGAVVASNDDMGAFNDVVWEGETRLVIEHADLNEPELVRTEWGGVRIVTRRVEELP